MNPFRAFRAFRGQGETPLAAKIVLMVAGSLGLLLALGFADPNNVRLMPTFFSSDHLSVGAPSEPPDEKDISRAIAAFNRALARAYLDLDAGLLAAIPLDDGLRQNYAKEIAFLKDSGRVLELVIGDIRVTEVARLPNAMLSVNTVEAVSVRYLNAKDRTVSVSYPEARYTMNYTLGQDASGWKITGVETVDAGRRNE